MSPLPCFCGSYPLSPSGPSWHDLSMDLHSLPWLAFRIAVISSWISPVSWSLVNSNLVCLAFNGNLSHLIKVRVSTWQSLQGRLWNASQLMWMQQLDLLSTFSISTFPKTKFRRSCRVYFQVKEKEMAVYGLYDGQHPVQSIIQGIQEIG